MLAFLGGITAADSIVRQSKEFQQYLKVQTDIRNWAISAYYKERNIPYQERDVPDILEKEFIEAQMIFREYYEKDL